MSGFFDFLDKIFDRLNREEGDVAADKQHSPNLLLGGILCVVGLLGLAGIAITYGVASHTRIENAAPDKLSDESMWKLLLDDMSSCTLERAAPLLENDDLRTLALFAAGRFNCPEVALHLIAHGVKLDDKRFVNGKISSIDEYAAEYHAVSVIEILQEERKRRETEMQRMAKSLKQQATKNSKTAVLQQQKRQSSLHAVLAEQAELKKSIHYDRARLDCEALKERLGYSAELLNMVECIRNGIESRRLERKEMGHNVPQ